VRWLPAPDQQAPAELSLRQLTLLLPALAFIAFTVYPPPSKNTGDEGTRGGM